MTTYSIKNRPGFTQAVGIILKLEGGDKVIIDSGGLTKYGISQRAYPDLDIEALTEKDAIDIYRRDYWNAVKGDDLEWPLNLLVFDAAVNQGVHAAVQMLQRAAGGLSIDGRFGPATLARVKGANQKELAALFIAERALRYADTRHFSIYGRGWMARLARVLIAAGEVTVPSGPSVGASVRAQL